MKVLLFVFIYGVLACLATNGIAQHHSPLASRSPDKQVLLPAMPGTSCTAPVIGYVPGEILERPVPLRTNLGKFHDPVTTNSAEAQAFYNQGVAYLHGYVWIEAARSFHQALRHDPKMAMAYVGLSRAYTQFRDYGDARRMAQKAEELANEVSEKERLRIKAQLARMAAIDSLHNEKLLKQYREALDAALAADMDNAELWLLRGNAEEALATGIGQQGKMATVPYYEAALSRSPEHPAAHHYLIHTYENLGDFQKAEAHGSKYAKKSPAVPHALHMYGHDLMKTGQIPAAIEYLGRADSLEQAYHNGERISPELDWHHGHNMALLGMSHRYLGQTKRAENLFRNIMSLKPFFDDYAFMFKADLIALLLSQERAKEVLQIVNTGKDRNALEEAFDNINAGRAYLILNKLPEAKASKARAEALMPEVGKIMPEWPGFAAFFTRTYIDFLDGLIHFQDPSTRMYGADKLRTHGQLIRNFFRGPDQWIAGLYELEDIARLARARGDWKLAADITDMLFTHDPHYAGSKYAKAQVLEQSGDKQAATQLYAEAAQLWADADNASQEILMARKKGAKIKAGLNK